MSLTQYDGANICAGMGKARDVMWSAASHAAGCIVASLVRGPLELEHMWQMPHVRHTCGLLALQQLVAIVGYCPSVQDRGDAAAVQAVFLLRSSPKDSSEVRSHGILMSYGKLNAAAFESHGQDLSLDVSNLVGQPLLF